MKDIVAVVAYRKPAGEGHFRVGLKVPWNDFVPGQFVMVEVPHKDVFLRRPFAIVGIKGGVLEICFKVVGRGTQTLSQLQDGDTISVLGPLGNGFSLRGDKKTAVLIAGGYGISSILSLANMYQSAGAKLILYYGAKKVSYLLYLDDLKSLHSDLHVATEDGSFGEKGLVTELLGRDAPSFNEVVFYACGPSGLLKEVSRIALENKIPAQISLESYMACGLGVCTGCVIKLRDGNYARACREGPVFDAGSLCSLW